MKLTLEQAKKIMNENNGDLDLSYSNITSLPSDLYVSGDLDISNTLI